MESNTIDQRQLCFILAFFFPVSRLIVLPSALAGTAGNDLLLAALFPLLLEGGATAAMLFCMSRSDKTLYDLLCEKIGGTATRIFFFLLAAYYLFSVFLPVLEHKAYVRSELYDSRPSFLVFLPFFFFSVFAAAKGLQAAGRSADLGMLLFIIAFVALMAMSFASADFTSLLPFAGSPFPKTLRAGMGVLNWFSYSSWLLFFQGRVKKRKKFFLKTFLSYLLGAFLTLLFLAVFYGIFSTVAVREFYAAAKIARYYNALKTIGRVDYAFIYTLLIVQLFALVLPLQLSVHALGKSFRSEKYPLFSLIVNGILFLFTVIFAERFASVERFMGAIFPVFLIFAYLLPFLSLLLLLPGRRRKAENADG